MVIVLTGGIIPALLSCSLFAGVTYDETVRTGSLDASTLVQSRVPSVDPPLFDIPLELYAPRLDGSPTIHYRILLEGDRLARIGKEETTVFDLTAHTMTVVHRKAHTYSVETLDEARERLQAMLKRWSSFPNITGVYATVVQKTGRRRQMGDQTAEEYRVIAIGPSPGRRRVAASSIYWMAPKSPFDELALFQLKWSRECDLPFPGMVPTDDSAFGVMASAAAKLPGYPMIYVVVDRPVPGAERTARRELDVPASRVPQSPGSLDEMAAGILLQIHVTETAFSDFVVGDVAPTVFAVPAGYKKKKPSGYPF